MIKELDKSYKELNKPYIVIETVNIENLEDAVSFLIENRDYTVIGEVTVIMAQPGSEAKHPKFRYYQALTKKPKGGIIKA